MRSKLTTHLWTAACLAPALAACDDGAPAGPDPADVSATYSNLLAMGGQPTLALTYDGTEMIGKNVYFRAADRRTGRLTLEGVIPGEEETTVDGVALAASGDGYAFSGQAAATATGATFRYGGTVGRGTLTVALTEVTLPPNRLSAQGTWRVAGLETAAPREEATPTERLLAAVAWPALRTLTDAALRQLTFRADGNLVARYVPLRNNPEGTAESPECLSMYAMPGDTLMRLYLNIDGIIRQVQSRDGSRAVPVLSLLRLYGKLSEWATSGITLRVSEGRQAGDILVWLDKEEAKALFESLRVALALLPEETLAAPAASALAAAFPGLGEDMAAALTGGLTVGGLMERTYEDLSGDMPFRVGLLLSKE